MATLLYKNCIMFDDKFLVQKFNEHYINIVEDKTENISTASNYTVIRGMERKIGYQVHSRSSFNGRIEGLRQYSS